MSLALLDCLSLDGGLATQIPNVLIRAGAWTLHVSYSQCVKKNSAETANLKHLIE
jgi:hypothetical protein